MQDVLSMVSQIDRPDLLVRTARHGLKDYVRNRHLKRALKTDVIPRPAAALMRLMEIEVDLEDERRQSRATYSFATHIEVLIALMAEASLLRGLRQAKAVAARSDT